jgi:hypothetical protein
LNERIKELIVQAQKEVWGNNPFNGSPEFEGYELDAEKFAQLIVGHAIECVRDVLRDENSDLSYVPASQVQKRIREHFGVKE